MCLLGMDWKYRHRAGTCLAELKVIGKERLSVGDKQKILMP